ncbi:TonB-dependent receptor [Edaphobacter sp. HDX4]|uniref:TonB-dependent receptor domain-containing protein n=1 Tax=Edaphobacter sp. HDX4 TaxID=2794064 RepID=UPI002FE61786
MKKLIKIVAPLFALGLFFLPSSVLQGQVANGVITGRLTDTTGAVVSNAQVTLTKVDTGLTVATRSNGDGIYTFPSLQTGPYKIQVSQSGFKNAETTLTLTVGQTSNIDLNLEVGSSTETVNVESAGMADLDTSDSTISYTVGVKQVSDLPLNGRNPYGLAALSPGIAPGGGFGQGVSQVRGAVVAAGTNNFESNGGQAGSNEIFFDGVPVTVCCQGQPALTPSVEVVDQFKVITSVPPAQFGRSSGGILNIVSKSGTNQLHGRVYEYLRNEKLDAAPYFLKYNNTLPVRGRNDFRAPHKFNQYGVFVNGPIWLPKIYNGRDKTFFTFGWEASRNVLYAPVTATVPTALQRQGVFTEAPGMIYDPYSTAGNTRQPLPAGCNSVGCFPAGKIVQNINPVSQKLLQFFPLPNVAGLTNNYVYANRTSDQVDQFNFRFDHNFSSKQRVFVRGTRDTNTHHENDLFNQASGPSGINQTLRAYLFALGDTWTITPRLILQTNYGFAYQKNFQIPQNYTGYTASDYGFTNLDSQQQLPGLPFVGITGYANVSYASNTNRWEHYSHFLESTALWQVGKHSLTFGHDGRLILEHQQSASNGPGTLSFDTTLTNGPNVTSAAASNQAQFDAFGAFLLGTFTNATLTRQVQPAYDSWYHAMYLQDDWRANSRLTLNLGLRYDIETGYAERYNRWADLDLNVANPLSSSTLPFTGGARYLGDNFPNRTWKTAYNKFGPRIGLAFQASDRVVLRGGYALMYLPTSQRFYGTSTLGYAQQSQTVYTSTNIPAATIANPFPNGVILPAGPAAGVTAGTGTSVGGAIYNNPLPYFQQINAGVETQIAQGIVLHLNYVGSHGVHLPINYRPNDLRDPYWGSPGSQTQIDYLNAQVANPFKGNPAAGPLATPATVQRVQLRSLYPQYTPNTGMANNSLTVNQIGIGASIFHAAQAFVTIQRSKNLSATVSYTFSKLMGNTSPLLTGFLNLNGTPGIQNSYHIRDKEWSVLATDVPHRLVANANYTLPFGRGQRFGGTVRPWVNQFVGGWSLNTIVAIQSGYALGITQTGGQAYSGSRPFFVPGGKPLTSGDVHQRLGGAGQSSAYLDASAFRKATAFELGDVPRSSGRLRSPSGFQDDLSLLKQFPIHENIALQFRLEAFNLLNKTQFGVPNTQFGSSTFGNITTQANSPRNIQAALKLLF